MRIALLGYGQMGKMIEEVANERQHEIVLRINSANAHEFNKDNVINADVAIEFTNPQNAYQNVIKCIDLGIPVVSGSTGWNDQLEQAGNYCKQKGGSFLHASNFSIGVNIFFEVNKTLARLMDAQPGYDVTIKEIHHTKKKMLPAEPQLHLRKGSLKILHGKNHGKTN